MSEEPGQRGWGPPPGGGAPTGGTSPDGSAPAWGTPPGGGTTPGWGSPPGGPVPPPPAPGGRLGPHQDWRQLPPEQLARLHQPGVVPLRPLYLGDVFGGALQTMRRNPEATIGMGFIVLAVLLIPSLLLSLALTRMATGLAPTDLTALTTLLSALMNALSSVALTGMIVHVVGRAVLGERAGLGETWRQTRGRIPALLGTLLIITVLSVVLVVAALLAVVLIVTLADQANGALAVVAAVLLMLGLVVVGLWAGCRVSLAPAPVVLEGAGPIRAVRRAWSLTRGRQAWRIVGITLLAALLTGIFSTLVQLPIGFVALLLLEPTGMTYSPTSPLLLTIDHLGQLLVGALTIPFTAGVTALLYLDQRMRREGLDVTLLRTAQERATGPQDHRRL